MSGKAAPGQNDCAVALCCDEKYFPFALFMIRQIAFYNPQRKFDFVIATQDDMEITGRAEDSGVRIHRPHDVAAVGNIQHFGGTLVPLFQLFLAKGLGHIYRRILYLDCNMFVEDGDIKRPPTLDVGSAELVSNCNSAPITFGQVARIAYRHMQSRSIIADRISRFPDPYLAHF